MASDKNGVTITIDIRFSETFPTIVCSNFHAVPTRCGNRWWFPTAIRWWWRRRRLALNPFCQTFRRRAARRRATRWTWRWRDTCRWRYMITEVSSGLTSRPGSSAGRATKPLCLFCNNVHSSTLPPPTGFHPPLHDRITTTHDTSLPLKQSVLTRIRTPSTPLSVPHYAARSEPLSPCW